MTSFVRILISALLLFVFPVVVNGKDVVCYKLVETTEATTKIGAIQFVSFIGDQCYESDVNGISVKNGMMKKNEYQSNRNSFVYDGTCFCGSGAKYTFSSDKATLTVTSKNGSKFIFRRVIPPKGVTTCSLIRPHSSEANNAMGFDDYTYNNSLPVQQPMQNDNGTNSKQNVVNKTKDRRKCLYCNGTGQITKDDNAPSNFGIEKPKQQCQICGKWYNPNVFVHYHLNCGHCGGTGFAK